MMSRWYDASRQNDLTDERVQALFERIRALERRVNELEDTLESTLQRIKEDVRHVDQYASDAFGDNNERINAHATRLERLERERSLASDQPPHLWTVVLSLHGQTALNSSHRLQGRYHDPPLDEVGQAQA
jgi:chromosome segregation ATPase